MVLISLAVLAGNVMSQSTSEQVLIEEYQVAYEAGDLNRLMDLHYQVDTQEVILESTKSMLNLEVLTNMQIESIRLETIHPEELEMKTKGISHNGRKLVPNIFNITSNMIVKYKTDNQDSISEKTVPVGKVEEGYYIVLNKYK